MAYPIVGEPTSFNSRKFIIYLHRNKINNKVYIGQTCVKPIERWGSKGQGYAKQPYFYSAIQKYGWDNFEHRILEEKLTQDQANEREQFWINFFQSNIHEFGYNLTGGGQGAHQLSAEILAHKKQALANYWQSEEGKTQAKKHSEEMLGSKNPMYGRCHSETTKQIMSEKKQGSKNPNYSKHFSDEHKAKISASGKGKHNHSNGNNSNAKAVFCPELNKYYETAKEAANDLGVCYKTILRRIKDYGLVNNQYHVIFVKEGE